MKSKKSRILAVLLCYSISSFGIFFSLIGSMLFLPIIIMAWVYHVTMCLKWINNEKIDSSLINEGTFCGILSFILTSVMLGNFDIVKTLYGIPAGILFVFPCFYLIIYIIKQNSEDENKQISN